MEKTKAIERDVALAVYAIAMGLIEAAVVVYLRELYYPNGFFIRSTADLKIIPANIFRIEVLRETATIVMLVSVAYLAFSARKARFMAFLFMFSLWDLVYYLFLYIFLAWPTSLTELDVYFLIPWPWVGPVWIPLVLFGSLAVVSLRSLSIRTPPKPGGH